MPDIDFTLDGIPEGPFKLVARTQSIEEADRIAEQYVMQGFQTKIVKKSQGGLPLYEVWVMKKPDIIS
jgi:hypothetical protein